LAPERPGRRTCELAAATLGAAEPQKLVWQSNLHSPNMGMGLAPQRMDLLDMVGPLGTAAPSKAPQSSSQPSVCMTAQWGAAQRLECTPIPAMDPFGSRESREESPRWKADPAHVAVDKLNITVSSFTASPSCSVDTESTAYPDYPDCPSPVHGWGRSPSVTAASVSPERSTHRWARTPSSAASPERGSPMRGWARTPSTVESPDLSPRRTKVRNETHPMQQLDMNLLNIFGNSGRGAGSGGFVPCRNNSPGWAQLTQAAGLEHF